MNTNAALILLLAMSLCAAGGVFSGDHTHERLTQSSETDYYQSVLCPPMPAALAPSLSVHSLSPADISSVYAVGVPASHRNEVFRVVNRLTELLSMFNPDVLTQNVENSVEQRTLQAEVEEISLYLAQDSQWKLWLLFVPASSLCPCSPHVIEDVTALVQEVEETLLIMHNKLHRSLVHVVVWSGPDHLESSCECLQNENINQRLHRASLLQTLQDSLDSLMVDKQWHSDDFSVVLQPVPVISESVNSVSDVNNMVVQLWTNMVPYTKRSEVMDSSLMQIPCPSLEQPYLRTQMNSPAEKEQRAHSTAPAAVDVYYGTELPCTHRSPSASPPTSVHEVRPADIKVVAAVGDSLTAANGVGAKDNNLLGVMTQYRGLSWSIGGDGNITTVTTLPNILKEFNPNVTGFSVGQGSQDKPEAFLNQAVAGAKSGNMVAQVRVLVDKMKTDPRIDFHNDWKVITMFVGGNDICDFCMDSVIYSPQNVINRIKAALDILHKEVPRAIVNLVELLNIVPLRELHMDSTLRCPTWLVNLICPCILKPKEGSAELQKVKDFNRAYQKAMRDLVESGHYDKHENFTVVLQPFFREVFLPKLQDGRPDRSYFTPDCFHLSQKAHTLMARALWNNMLEPLGNKTYTQDFTQGIALKCPSETTPFLRTALNSNYTFSGPPPVPPPITNWGSDFSCVDTAPSQSVPTSVHRLRPADIKIVGALGDSITTGFGAKAKNLMQLRTEYKGVSWSIGGDQTLEKVTTLPNILRKFNPDLKGMSTGQGNLVQSKFNMAVSGAKIAGIPAQVRRLIDDMKTDPSVDFQNDWKLITLFIGGNDLCSYCNDRATLSPQNYSRHMMESLDILYNEVPRLLVNVLEILQIEGLRMVKRDSLGCSVLQQYVCTCFLAPGENSPELSEIKRVNQELQVETEKLVYSGRYDGREDFAVVAQPFFKNSIVPLNDEGSPDTTYFSEDCFHFSERGHSNMATALWNNMLEPVGKKQTFNNFSNARNDLKCPTKDHPYIFTKLNSLPPETTTSPPTPPPTTPSILPECENSVPVWLSPVLAVAGLLIGCAVTWLFFSCRAKKNKKTTTVEMNGTMF
ncbi:phospholipase B1, membrane-associated isoform X2 [Periophthalmus magnuspinnatus]|uniref:phospholipase B1, membrane-associated isoform X2 n=1 Tax=Periophthalmus magnuspinnatus TaxID=409849 RepID=UPI002436C230|nr:phospholipase B1, membrane-associated isoform X2 [Periophthalmus magnuspinnatus]